jgi:2-methylcitrate dehydratase
MSQYPGAETAVILPKSTNQARGIGRFAVDFLSGSLGPGPDLSVQERTQLFHTDSILCGFSALSLRANAPTLLREEALEYPDAAGAKVFGSQERVKAEKAVAANSSAVREWDSNGTNFGSRPSLGHNAGEFGHNDYYPVAAAACQERGLAGREFLLGMILIDEIRGRLAEVFSLKTYKIDHVVHGGIASAAAYAALHGGTEEQIEHAIGMYVAHYIPWRAIRAGKQLSDSKGASAALAAEAAVLCAKRALRGFVGPKDIFRNPESMFRQFVKTDGDSPFDLVLSHSGDDFAVMGMHFKLGLYEHQSAGALQAAADLILATEGPLDIRRIEKITIKAYEPAFGIIGDPAKRNPTTRQSADHSMVYILATLLRKAEEGGDSLDKSSPDALWKSLMLLPSDYGKEAIANPQTRKWMDLITFVHGGEEYDSRYPEGIPTSLTAGFSDGTSYDSGLVMFPSGHALNQTANLLDILGHKFREMEEISFGGDSALVTQLGNLNTLTPEELLTLFDAPYRLGAAVD